MKPRITIAPTPDTVVAQISNLPKLGMPEIKSLWRRLFGGDTPTHNRQFLERRIAYKLQIIEYRKTDRNLLERNASDRKPTGDRQAEITDPVGRLRADPGHGAMPPLPGR